MKNAMAVVGRIIETAPKIIYPNGKPGEGIVIRANDSSWSFR